MTRSRKMLCLLVLVGVSLPLGAAASSPSWQTILSAKIQGAFPLGWASGRVWFAVENDQANVTVWSGRLRAGGLTSLVSTPEGQSDWILSSFVAGSSLVASFSQPGGTDSSIAELSASGKVGAWASLPNDPENAVQAAFTPAGQSSGKSLADSAVTNAGRTVWAIAGITCPSSAAHKCTVNGGGFPHLGLCCTADGKPTDLSALVTTTKNTFAGDTTLATDAHGRLWLAWAGGARASQSVALKLVQLNPATLMPLALRTLDPAPIYDRVGNRSFVLACADTCRLVYQGRSGASVWNGSSVTLLWKNDLRKDTGGLLLGATARGAGLGLASWHRKVPNAPDDGLVVSASHAGAGGQGVRALGSLELKLSIPHGATHAYALLGVPFAIATPSGFACFAFYMSDDASPGKLLGAVLRG